MSVLPRLLLLLLLALSPAAAAAAAAAQNKISGDAQTSSVGIPSGSGTTHASASPDNDNSSIMGSVDHVATPPYPNASPNYTPPSPPSYLPQPQPAAVAPYPPTIGPAYPPPPIYKHGGGYGGYHGYYGAYGYYGWPQPPSAYGYYTRSPAPGSYLGEELPSSPPSSAADGVPPKPPPLAASSAPDAAFPPTPPSPPAAAPPPPLPSPRKPPPRTSVTLAPPAPSPASTAPPPSTPPSAPSASSSPPSPLSPSPSPPQRSPPTPSLSLPPLPPLPSPPAPRPSPPPPPLLRLSLEGTLEYIASNTGSSGYLLRTQGPEGPEGQEASSYIRLEPEAAVPAAAGGLGSSTGGDGGGNTAAAAGNATGATATVETAEQRMHVLVDAVRAKVGDRISLLCGLEAATQRCLTVGALRRVGGSQASGGDEHSPLAGRQAVLVTVVALLGCGGSSGGSDVNYSGRNATTTPSLPNGGAVPTSNIVTATEEEANAWLGDLSLRLDTCSRGLFTVDRDRSAVVTLRLQCSEELLQLFRDCKELELSKRLAFASIGADSVAYTRADIRAFLVPTTPGGWCTWRGMSLAGEKQVFVTAGANRGLSKPWVGVHEVLHVHGLKHSARLGPTASKSEEEDPTTPMGCNECGSEVSICPNAPQMYYLGWSDPVRELAGKDLPMGFPFTITLPAQSMNRSSCIRLQPDWLPAADGASGGAFSQQQQLNLYLSLRVSDDVDLGLDDSVAGRVLLHQVPSGSDVRRRAAGGEHVVTQLRGARAMMGDAETLDLPELRLVLRTGRTQYGGDDGLVTKDVTICRYSTTGSSVDCTRRWPPAPPSPPPQPPPFPPQPKPPAPPAPPAVLMTVGAEHVCLVVEYGELKCFGDNENGQLGLGDVADRGDQAGELDTLPAVDLGYGLRVTSVVAGSWFTCALLQPGGLVKCWGYFYGSVLGQGDYSEIGNEPGELGDRLRPINLGSGYEATAIACGGYHSCALLQSGNVVKCWGENNRGQLGIGDVTDRGRNPSQMGDALPAVDFGPGLTPVALAVGGWHSCAILNPGRILKCWGHNNYGQLGQGSVFASGYLQSQMGANLPVTYLGAYEVTQVAAGSYHTCALLQPGGVVKCWGQNSNGQVGVGSTASRGNAPSETGDALRPVEFGPGLFAAAIAAGDAHSCALLQPGGVVKCWGANSVGQLGQGDTANRGDEPGEVAAQPPINLGTGLTAVSIHSGAYSDTTCALLQPGDVIKCWGGNTGGQLGTGDTRPRGYTPGDMGDALPNVRPRRYLPNPPMPPHPPPSPPVPSGRAGVVAAGAAHICVLLDGGKVKCWGNNENGRLGLGDIDNRGDQAGELDALPVLNLGRGLSAVFLAAGWRHSCAILQPGGMVKCWGDNRSGQLGLGHNTSFGDKPGSVGAAVPATVDLGPGLQAVLLAAGSYHTCALLQPGSVVKCWGLNDEGQLGLGDAVNRGDVQGQMGGALPAVDFGPGLKPVALAVGGYHTCALLQPGGFLKCWGYNAYGQLGIGTRINKGDAQGEMGSALRAADLGPGLYATAVAAGDYHTCAVLQPGGLVKCWGLNDLGQLSIGSNTSRGGQANEMGAALAAVPLGSGLSATVLAAGLRHTCALLQPGGRVKCWGGNAYGELGQGDTAARGDDGGELLPVEINLGSGLLATALSAAAKGAFTCALLHPGSRVKCWGDNRSGQLGLGDTNNRGDQYGEMGDALLSIAGIVAATDSDMQQGTMPPGQPLQPPSAPPPSAPPSPSPPPPWPSVAVTLGDAGAAPWSVVSFPKPDAAWISVAAAAAGASSSTSLLSVTFSRAIQVEEGAALLPALLHIRADDEAVVHLNGVFVGSVVGWQAADGPIPLMLQSGSNTVAIRCVKYGNSSSSNSVSSGPGSAAVEGSGNNGMRPPAVLAVVVAANGSFLAWTDELWELAVGQVKGAYPLGPDGVAPWNLKPGTAATWFPPNTGAVWIWSSPNASTSASSEVAPVFCASYVSSLTDAVALYDLHVVADDEADLYVNGQYVSTFHTGWGAAVLPLTLRLRAGRNLLCLRCFNARGIAGPNPAGLLVALQDASGRTVLRTDETWRFDEGSATDRSCADKLLQCAGWASGYCGAEYSWEGKSLRKEQCRRSCKTCFEAPGALQTSLALPDSTCALPTSYPALCPLQQQGGSPPLRCALHSMPVTDVTGCDRIWSAPTSSPAAGVGGGGAGAFNLLLRTNADLAVVRVADATVLWSTGTGVKDMNVFTNSLKLNRDGTWSLLQARNVTASSNSFGVTYRGNGGERNGPFSLSVRDDSGVVELRNAAGRVAWTSSTDPGPDGFTAATIGLATPFNNKCGCGSVIYIDRHNTSCPRNYALSGFRLTRGGADVSSQIQFVYSCIRVNLDSNPSGGDSGNNGSSSSGGAVDSLWSSWTSTQPTADTYDQANAGEGVNGDTRSLFSHAVFCSQVGDPDGAASTQQRGVSLLTGFRLARPTSSTVAMSYGCTTSSWSAATCTLESTPATDDGGGDVIKLDRHDVQCPAGRALVHWELVRTTPGNYRIEYHCCRPFIAR